MPRGSKGSKHQEEIAKELQAWFVRKSSSNPYKHPSSDSIGKSTPVDVVIVDLREWPPSSGIIFSVRKELAGRLLVLSGRRLRDLAIRSTGFNARVVIVAVDASCRELEELHDIGHVVKSITGAKVVCQLCYGVAADKEADELQFGSNERGWGERVLLRLLEASDSNK